MTDRPEPMPDQAAFISLRDGASSEIRPSLATDRVTRWHGDHDVIVIGFGLAGASAALEAADQGQDVLLVDRFDGGGSSQMSGGIVYAGGGTHVQKAFGVEDSPAAMADYLRREVGGFVSDETVRRFAEDSCDSLAFLERHNVHFSGPPAPKKTSYPTDEFYLYFSDNGEAPAYRGAHPPAERGHRVKNPELVPGARQLEGVKPHGGFSEGGDCGWYLMAAMKEAVRDCPRITVLRQTRAVRLVTEQERVIGAEMSSLRGPAAALHRWAERMANKLTLQVVGGHRPFAALFRTLEAFGRRRRFRARSGVVIAAGGYIRNRAMIDRFAPDYARTMPIGSFGDDGAGIRLGVSAGGAADHLDRVSAWRFINPPFDWTKGVIIGAAGTRLVNEELYGAHIARAMCEASGGRAWLVCDAAIWASAFAEVDAGRLFDFQKFPVNLAKSRALSADSIEALAAAMGVPCAPMREAIRSYSDDAATGAVDSLGKSDDCRQAFAAGPYYAVSLAHEMPVSPLSAISTGGLRVEESSGNVLDAAGGKVAGLFAAGRSAVGLPVNNYVSGLSLADCVWSGRRAAAAIAAAARQD